jgi:hypothetical protein
MKNKKSLVYIFLFFSFYSFGCGGIPIALFEISRTESYRVKSPDGEVDAVLIESDAGATIPVSYHLFILPKGASSKELSFDRSQLLADKVQDLRITWIENKILQIDCKSARIFRFSNFWQSKEIQDYRYIVEIKISPTCRL